MRIVLTLLLTVSLATAAQADALRVAVAANFRYAFEALEPAMTEQLGARPQASYGASGMLFAQIMQGAPFDVFLSADAARPEALMVAGRTDGPAVTYALGQLALWLPDAQATAAAPVHPAQLKQADGQRFALANPDLAPYGAAARACLEHLGLWEALKDRAVYGASVGQAFHFVASGAVPAGFIAYSQALARDLAPQTLWLAPPECHPPIEQKAAVLRGNQAATAHRLLSLLTSAAVQQQLASMGYRPIPAPGARP